LSDRQKKNKNAGAYCSGTRKRREPVELFRGVNVDWLKLKWYFLGFSLIFSVAGIISMGMNWAHPVGGTQPGALERGLPRRHRSAGAVCQDAGCRQIRKATEAAGIKDAQIQPIRDVGAASSNEVLISLPEQNQRNRARCRPPADHPGCAEGALRQPISRANVSVVGPTVGKQLEKQACWPRSTPWLGMLVYLWFRFQLIYGVAAVVACFHDTLITVGAFALTGQEISLTVIAAILTLVGYSMNDTIVVFDRIRENLRLSRRERFRMW
jgi:preprotein translocase subunit SecF